MVAACLAPAPGAARAAESPVELILSLKQPKAARAPSLPRTLLLDNCDQFFDNGRSPDDGPGAVYAGAAGTPVGALDVARGHGSAYVRRSSWQIEAFKPSRLRPLTFTDLGVALHGHTLYLTARVTHGRAFSVAARRIRLAVVRRARLSGALLIDGRRRPVPNTFTALATGTLRMLPAMSRALSRMRCHGPRNPTSHAFRSGYRLGQLTVGLRPGRATGLAGTVKLKPQLSDTTDDVPVTVTAAAGATAAGAGAVSMPISSGLPAPLSCFRGEQCAVSGGALGLGGGFELVFAGRQTSIAGMTIAITGTPPDDLEETVTGTIDGALVTIAAARPNPGLGIGFSDDFLQRVSAALGTDVDGELTIQPLFTTIGP